MIPGSPRPARRHSVWGRVVDALGGAVSRAEVFWVGAQHAGQTAVDLLHAHKVAQCDSDGRFWAPDLPQGDCLLVPDFQRMNLDGDRLGLAAGTPLTVPLAGDDLVPLLFPFRRTDYGTMDGVVEDEVDGRPDAHVHVALFDASGTKILRETDTHTNGSFEFTLLPPGKYNLAVWGTLRHARAYVAVELLRNKRMTVKLRQKRRPPGALHDLRVRVESYLGQPVARARVTPTVPDTSIAPRSTDGEGLVEFTGLPDRPALVVASAQGFWPEGAPVPQEPPSETPEATVVLQRSAKLRIAVRDAATGRALRYANLLVAHSGGDYRCLGGVLPSPDDPPKDHQIVDVRPGEVVVRAESPGYGAGESRVEVATFGDGIVPVTMELEPSPDSRWTRYRAA